MDTAPNVQNAEFPLPPIRRPLRVLDLMALVAAVALTLIAPAIIRAIVPARSLQAWDRRQYVAHIVSLALFWWTLTAAALALIEDRRNLRHACRRPGHAAIFAVTAAFLFLVLQRVVSALLLAGVIGWPPGMIPYFWLFAILEQAPHAAAASVVTVWLLLATINVERSRSDWFDRLGCVVGSVWVLWGLTNQLIWHLPIPWLTTSGIDWNS
jgi:hypothetical protein